MFRTRSVVVAFVLLIITQYCLLARSDGQSGPATSSTVPATTDTSLIDDFQYRPATSSTAPATTRTRPSTQTSSGQEADKTLAERIRQLLNIEEWADVEFENIKGETSEVLAEGEPAFTKKQAEAYMKELIPLVEKITGRKFKTPPRIKLVNRKEITKVLIEEISCQYRNLYRHFTNEQIQEMSQRDAKLYAMISLGKYGFTTKTTYLLPRNFFPWMKLAGIDMKHTESIIKLVIAHELTHVMQDQHVGLKRKILAMKSLDELNAFNATIEGHAVLVQELAGKVLKMDKAVADISAFYSFGSPKNQKDRDPATELLGKIISAYFKSIYLGGRSFMEYHYKKGGNKRLWHILNKPPVASSMIRKPETYSSVRRKGVNYATILEGLEKHFGNRKWAVRNLALGDTMLQAAYASVDPDERKLLLDNIAHTQALIAQDADVMGNVSLFILKNANFGPKMIAITEEAARKNVAKMKGASLTFEDVTFEDFKGVKADAARLISMNIKSGDEVLINQVLIRICRGKVVVEIITHNNPLNDSQIKSIIDEIFRRLSTATTRASKCKKAA